MSTSFDRLFRDDSWWAQLGFPDWQLAFTVHEASDHFADLLDASAGRVRLQANPSDRLTLEQFRDRLREAKKEARRKEEEKQAALVERRRQLGWQMIEAAYSAPDADGQITTGRWAGFSRGDATAWCWNLFQYEFRGLAHPKIEVLHRGMEELQAGGLPEALWCPERAHELHARGLKPREYRQHHEALGSPTHMPRLR